MKNSLDFVLKELYLKIKGESYKKYMLLPPRQAPHGTPPRATNIQSINKK
jgi:hypothetical protein